MCRKKTEVVFILNTRRLLRVKRPKKGLPAAERAMLSQMTPESFDPAYLKKVLEREYSGATDEEISLMMAELMPRIKILLESPDFMDIMKRQALLFHNTRRKHSFTTKHRKKTKWEPIKKGFRDKENATIDLTGTSESMPGTSKHNYYSGSDDSDFLYVIGNKPKRNKGKRKPLKVWGIRNGRAFGSPEKDF